MSQGRRARSVGAALLVTRASGFVREKVVAFFLGVSPFTDVLASALRVPNLLQNLLGEQALSASFIPIYSRLLEREERQRARGFALGVLALLIAIVVPLVILGVVLARPIVLLFNVGYASDTGLVSRLDVATDAVRILFPMTGMLVLSAWCLAILNSHSRFFLPYVVPTLWNGSIIAGLLWVGTEVGRGSVSPAQGRSLVLAAAVGALIGGVLQLGSQLLPAWRLLGPEGEREPWRSPLIGEFRRRLLPAMAGRGVAQISGYLDLLIASLLAVGTQAAIYFAQRIYFLPLALFATSIAVVELPALSRAHAGARDTSTAFAASQRRMALLMAPSLVGLFLFGLPIVQLLYGGGAFGRASEWLVYLVVAAYAVGLLATAQSRLLQNVYFAHSDTRTPATVAALRVTIAAFCGAGLSWFLDGYTISALVPGVEEATVSLGAVGLGLGSALGAWAELFALRRRLRRIASLPLLAWRAWRVHLLESLAATIPALLLWLFLDTAAWWRSILVLGAYGGGYGALLLARGHLDGGGRSETPSAPES